MRYDITCNKQRTSSEKLDMHVHVQGFIQDFSQGGGGGGNTINGNTIMACIARPD